MQNFFSLKPTVTIPMPTIIPDPASLNNQADSLIADIYEDIKFHLDQIDSANEVLLSSIEICDKNIKEINADLEKAIYTKKIAEDQIALNNILSQKLTVLLPEES